MEDHAGVDLMLAENSGQSLGIEAHIEQRELADMHVRINSHRFTPGDKRQLPSADSSTESG
jgi:hypothetical protein